MTATVLVDEAARRRITTDGLDELLFVEAGAGTGKTKQLVDRVVALALDRGIPIHEIAAVTFTEAAAAELRTRIREAFERLIDDDATPDDRRHHAEAALDELDSAAIGTVHSFAQRLLSEHPIEAGLPPHVEVLDEVESLLAFGDRWDEHVDEMFADDALDEVLICARLLGVRIDDPRQPSLRNVAGTFGDNWDRLADVAAIAAEVPAVDRAVATTAMAELADLVDRCRAFPEDKLAERLLGNEAEMIVVRRALVEGTDRSVWRALAARQAAKAKWSHKSAGTARTWGDGDQKRAAVEVVIAAEDALRSMYCEAADAVLRVLAGSVARFTLDAATARRREGRLEFHDLLVLARQLLRNSEPARAALHGRYTRLLIDEFQDTDPIQIELAVLLAATIGDGPVPERWQDVVVDDARLFFVGDAKQSIYRFRRADIGLFLDARDRFVDESVRLTTNFRTVPAVVDWVNAVFGVVMDEEVEGRRPRYEPLVADRAGSGGDHRVVLLGGPHTAEEKKEQKITAARLRELEASAVADAVAGILADPESWPVEDREKKWRAARADDITVLLPTRTSLGVLTDALRSRRIEFRAEIGTLVYDTQEVRDLLAVMRTVAHPGDAVALVASLRSPIFACGDDDLLTYVAAGGRWDGSGRPDGLDPAHPVVVALDCLDELRAARWWTGPAALLERVIRDRRVMTLAFGAPRARDVWRRLRFLVDQARLFEASQSADLVEFVAWAELQRSDMARVHEPLLPEPDDCAVRIMTMHGAKGLEFPITVLSGLTTKLTGRRSGFQVYWEDDGGVVLRAKANLASVGFDRRADLEAEMDDEEKHRLLYVACTRARDHLLVATHHIQGTPCFAAIAWDRSQDAGADLWRAGDPGPTLAAVAPPVASGDATDEVAWASARRALLAQAGRRTVVSATAVKREAVGVPADAEVDPITDLVDAQDDITETVPDWRRGRGATAFGRAVHAVLQDVDLATGVDVDALAGAAAAAEGVPARVAEIAAATRAILGAPIMREAARASVAREMYVAAPIGDRVVEGYIDLLVRTPDGLVVVDYKTDHVEGAAAIDARADDYALQLAAYAAAVEAATGEPVRAGVLVFGAVPGATDAVERRFTRDELDTERVAAVLAQPG